MHANPLVSIVTISYNQADFLEETILSVINQSYKNIEYIIFDGGSIDGSVEIIEKYKEHFAHINIGPDGGAAAALNSAFKIASGDLHAYINSDDVLNNHTVQTWVDVFNNNQDVDIVFGDIEIIDENGQPSTLPGRKVSKFLSGPVSQTIYACGASAIPQQASCCKAEVFKAVGGFDERNRTCWDGEFFVDAFIKNFKAKRVSGLLAKFRVHSQSISGTNKHEEYRVKDHARMREKWNSANLKPAKPVCLFLKFYVKSFRAIRYLF
ncbi:glycosyltransferase family 2 protein [Neptunomonas sp.]|uniref:glycosyltransferase family 2 protein n=1 Tax=Neptunomonas sp. TaxID=1971898 RepID=UPI0035618BCE